MPYLYRRSSAPVPLPSSLPPSTLSSFSFFPHSHAISGPRPSVPPPPCLDPAVPLTLNLPTSPPLLFSLALLSPTRRLSRPRPTPPPFSFYFLSAACAPLPPAGPAPLAPLATLCPSSFARPRKDDTSGAIKSALIAAPDNSIPRVKIIGQERGAVRRWAVPPRSIRAACVSRLPGGGWWDGG